MTQSLDKFDLQLLSLLQRNNQLTATALSEAVPLSPSAITRRVRRLRTCGAIVADVAVVSSTLTKSWLHVLIRVQLKEHANQPAIARFKRSIIEREEIQLCLETSGAFDLTLFVIVHDTTVFTSFADEYLGANPIVARYETELVKKDWKGLLTRPLPLTSLSD